MFMNRVHTVTQKHSRVKNPGQKPNWLHEPPTGPASAPGHAQAARPARPRPAPRAPTPSAPRAHACRARLLVRTPRAPCACCLPPAARVRCAPRAPARHAAHARLLRSPSTHARPAPQRPLLRTPAPLPAHQPRAQRLPARALRPVRLAQSTKWAVAHHNFSVLKIFIFHDK